MVIRIKSRAGESAEQMMRRFKKLCEKEGLTKDIKRKEFYEKPSERMRRRIINEFAKSNEAPGALLALARGLTERGEAVEEARQYLEKLIIEHPRSALVPQARQELDRLQGRVPRS